LPEWSNGTDSKSVELATVPRVLTESPRSTEPAQQAKERQSAATAALAEGEAHSAE